MDQVLGVQPIGLGTKRDMDCSSSSFREDSSDAKTVAGRISHSLPGEQLDNYQRQRSVRDSGDSFGSTSNSTSSGVPDYSSEDEDDDGLTMGSHGAVGLGVVAGRTAFPKRPTIVIPSAERDESSTLERYLSTPDTEFAEQAELTGYVHFICSYYLSYKTLSALWKKWLLTYF